MKSVTLWVLFAIMIIGCVSSLQEEMNDPYLWLEEVESPQALDWVAQRNEESLQHLTALPEFDDLKDDALAILNSKDRIPTLKKRGDYWYNFWQDQNHKKGIYRRTSLASYRSSDTEWETVLDFDAMAEEDGVSWVYKGLNCLEPEGTRCLLNISDGGADAVVTREFDLDASVFVTDGFSLDEAKSEVTWKNKDTIYVGTDFGPGSMTSSGYPRTVREWKRGAPLEDAKVVFEGDEDSVWVSVISLEDLSHKSNAENKDFIFVDATTFFTAQYFYLENDKSIQLKIPNDATIAGYYKEHLFVSLRSEWQGFKAGSVIYAPLKSVVNNDSQFKLFAEPTKRRFIQSIEFAKDFVLIGWINNVSSELEKVTLNEDLSIANSKKYSFPGNGVISLSNVETDSNHFTALYENFLTPPTYYLMSDDIQEKQQLRAMPSMFDNTDLVIAQKAATSKDGTSIPYFIVYSKNMKFDGKNPTQLYAYGGFEVSRLPSYSSITGKLWLERGGVYVLANIRGGGEFGPAWHQAALKENRHKVFEDLEAVAEHLFETGVTSPDNLGIRGGSNGGLLVGAAFTRRPDLYGAVVCQVPLLDMKRYNKLLAGASWMAEYGNPDIPEEWAYIKTYSPYQNVFAGRKYPRVFFTTSTRDDRVHPAHARKMVAKMQQQGHDIFYFENTEGGHAGAADNENVAKVYALIYSYLADELTLRN